MAEMRTILSKSRGFSAKQVLLASICDRQPVKYFKCFLLFSCQQRMRLKASDQCVAFQWVLCQLSF